MYIFPFYKINRNNDENDQHEDSYDIRFKLVISMNIENEQSYVGNENNKNNHAI